MPSYDDDSPTQEEQVFLNQLVNSHQSPERLELLTELRNRLLGSRRSKVAFSHGGISEILFEFLRQYSSESHLEILPTIFDCLASLAKSNNEKLFHRLIELGFIEELWKILSFKIESIVFHESALRCLRAFYYTNEQSTSNGFLHESKCNRSMEFSFPVNYLDLCRDLFPRSRSCQMSILEILSTLAIDNERQNLIVEKDFIPLVLNLLLEKNSPTVKSNSISDSLVALCLKFFCSISLENSSVCQLLHDMDENVTKIIGNFLTKTHRSPLVSFYAAKFFVHLCKCEVLSPDDSYVSLLSLTTLIHISMIHQSVSFFLDCLNALIYLLDGNHLLHHQAIYSEQFLNQLFSYVLTPKKYFPANLDEVTVKQIRSTTLSLLAVLASDHVDIQKRIAEKENLISTTIDCYRSSDLPLQIAALRLFHGLSRSVDQLHTTFNDTICEILLEALKSNDLSLMKTSSCVITNSVLEFSSCRSKLLSSGILDILLSFLSHHDQELTINCIWALRNLAYLSTLQIKQDIIRGMTIDRIYSLLEQCTDEKFLLCLISLLQNLFHEKHIDIILPLFNSNKLQSTLEQMLEKTYPDKLRQELKVLIEHLNSNENSCPSRSSADSVNSTCRTFLFPEYAYDEMDQLDCS